MIRSKLIELLKVITGYDGDDDVEVTMLAYVYENLHNFECKKCFLFSFLEIWLEMDSMTTAIMGNMREDNGGKANVILPYLHVLEGIKKNEHLTFQNTDVLIPDKVGCWVHEMKHGH